MIDEEKMMERIFHPAILDETASDESFLVGTYDQIATLIRQMQALLDVHGEESNWHGVDVRLSSASGSLPDTMVDTCLRGLVVVESENEGGNL